MILVSVDEKIFNQLMNMKKLKIAKHAGFCFGVKRAVEMVERELEKGRKVYCLGELIHNSQVIARMKQKGMVIVDAPEEIPSGSLFVIRSHGISPKLVEEISHRGAQILDATCPFVRKAQLVAKNFIEAGYETLICGDPNHAEVIGIRAWTDDRAKVVNSKEEAEKIQTTKPVGILSQTTQKVSLLQDVASVMIEKAKGIVVENTICLDSSTKQKEVSELAREVEVMIVVGGINSSNTTKLVQISGAQNIPTHHIETSDELQSDWFRTAESIGIAAGASTAQFLIDEVEEKIRSFDE